MSAATRAAGLVGVVIAIGVAAKATRGGKKTPEQPSNGEQETSAPPVTVPTGSNPGGGPQKPSPIRTGEVN